MRQHAGLQWGVGFRVAQLGGRGDRLMLQQSALLGGWQKVICSPIAGVLFIMRASIRSS
jgi:hypothetical protein